MRRKKDKNRTIQTNYRFTIDELGLITESIMMFRTAGTRIGVGLAKQDGTLWSPAEVSMLPEDDKHRMFESGEIKIVPMAGQELTDEEEETLDHLFEIFNGGLGRCEEKIEEADIKTAEENIDDVIKGFYNLLKEEK